MPAHCQAVDTVNVCPEPDPIQQHHATSGAMGVSHGGQPPGSCRYPMPDDARPSAFQVRCTLAGTRLDAGIVSPWWCTGRVRTSRGAHPHLEVGGLVDRGRMMMRRAVMGPTRPRRRASRGRRAGARRGSGHRWSIPTRSRARRARTDGLPERGSFQCVADGADGGVGPVAREVPAGSLRPASRRSTARK